jgi:hypothetical protein
MVGRTLRMTMTSGVAPALSGLVTGFSIDATGSLKYLKVAKNDGISGVVRIAVYADSGLVIDNQTVTFQSGAVLPSVDLFATSVQLSGSTLVSGTPTMAIGFVNNLTVQYTCTSGSVNIVGLVDINRNIIQT